MKKIVGLSLAAVMLLGTAVGFAGCGNKGNNGNNGNNGSGKVTPISDTEKAELFAALASMEAKGITGTLDMRMADSSEEPTLCSTMAGMTELSVVFGETVQADLMSYTKSGYGGEEATESYDFSFVRGSVSYSCGAYATDIPSGTAEGDFAAVLAKIKADGTEIYGTDSGMGGSSSLPMDPGMLPAMEPAAFTMLGNLLDVGGATAGKTANGYVISADLVKLLQNYLDRASAIVESLKIENTLKDVLNGPDMSDLMGKLYKGIKARDILAAIPEGAIPSGIVAAFPEAGELGVWEYVGLLASSEDFFTAVAENTNMPQDAFGPDVKCFGDIGIGTLITMIGASSTTPEGTPEGTPQETVDPEALLESAKAMARGYKAALEKQLVCLLLNVSTPEQLIGDSSASIVLELTFDGEKRPVGFAVDIDAAGAYAESEHTVSSTYSLGIALAFSENVALVDLDGYNTVTDAV